MKLLCVYEPFPSPAPDQRNSIPTVYISMSVKIIIFPRSVWCFFISRFPERPDGFLSSGRKSVAFIKNDLLSLQRTASSPYGLQSVLHRDASLPLSPPSPPEGPPPPVRLSFWPSTLARCTRDLRRHRPACEGWMKGREKRRKKDKERQFVEINPSLH